jgi:hypothetical protein
MEAFSVDGSYLNTIRDLPQPCFTIQAYGSTVPCMKTTIDLPDELVFQAKSVALSRKTTLRNLVLIGLQREIQSPLSAPASPWEALLVLDRSPWEGLPPDEYVQSLRQESMSGAV